LRHLKNIAPNGLGLAALFGVDAGVCARRVHKGEHGQLEFLSQLHQAQGLAVTLGLGHAEVAQPALFGVAAFLVTQQHAGLAVESSQAAHDGQIIGKVAVAVQLNEVGENLPHDVQGVGTVLVSGDLGDLPRREVAVNVFGQLHAFGRQLVDLVGDIHRRFVLHVTQFVDLGLQLLDGLFEIQKILL